MQKRTFISILSVVLVLLAGTAFWALQRGILRFEEGKLIPQFSMTAVTNPIPSLDREAHFPADFTPQAKEIYKRNVERLIAAIRTNVTDASAWLDLAIYYRMVGDDMGALEIWQYLREAYPNGGISMHNLGEYYFHTKKDYKTAEKYYRESITAEPALTSNYTDLYEMYRYVYKQDTSAAADILKEGTDKAGGESPIQLYIMLGRHYRDVLKDNTNASKYLTIARDAAAARGDRAIATELTAEIRSL